MGTHELWSNPTCDLILFKRWGKGSMSHNQSYTHVFHEHWIWPWQTFQLEAPHMVQPKKPTTTTALPVSSSAYSILTRAGCQIKNLITRAGSSEIWLKRKGTTAMVLGFSIWVFGSYAFWILCINFFIHWDLWTGRHLQEVK